MKLRQWFCDGPGGSAYIFTPADYDAATALAIAQATNGRAGTRSVVDEGTFVQDTAVSA